MKRILAFLTAIWLLTSCTALQKNQMADTEKKLLAAGFVVTHVDNPEQLARLGAKQQHHMIVDNSSGETYYDYYDIKFCQCWYRGNEQALNKFLNLVSTDNSIVTYDPVKEAENMRAFARFGGRF